MRIIYLLGSVLLYLGCANDTTEPIVNDQKVVSVLDSLSTQKINVALLQLSSEAEESIEELEDFKNLRSMMVSLNEANAFFIRKHKDSIGILVNDLEENLSDDYRKNNITSRINLLATASGLLMQLAEKDNPEAKELLNANAKLAEAYNSLVIQLNELSLAIPDSIEEELLRGLESEEEEEEENPKATSKNKRKKNS